MKLSRRRRGVLWTIALTSLFVIVTVAVLVSSWGRDEVYRPGEAMDRLSSELSRSLPDDHPRVQFVDVAEAAGISFRHFGGTRTSQLPEDMGSGAAWGDFDNDGWPDLYVVNFAGPISGPETGKVPADIRNHLYRNRGDGTFEEVARQAGVDTRAFGMGAAWGDFDNDGWLDLAVTNYGSMLLYRNNGDGTFGDVSNRAGLASFSGFWSGPSWGDYDRDGYLDLYIPGYVTYDPSLAGGTSRQYDIESPAAINPSSFAPLANLLFHNLGNGRFEEVALPTGVSNEGGRSLSAAWADLDGDGFLDLYVANDVSDNALYRNLGNGVFEDVSYPALVADYRGAMGIGVGDWNADGDQDLFITHWLAQENALYENTWMERSPNGQPVSLRFMDVADRFGLGQVALDFVGWGTGFLDYDNDGRPDLFVANGSTLQDSEQPETMIPMTDLLFWNRDSEEGFFDVSSVAGQPFGEKHLGRGVAYSDYDRDGDIDIFVVHHGGRAALLQNSGVQGRSWLTVALQGRTVNRSGLGSTVRVVAGERRWEQQIGAQASYCSQHEPVAHFGLGDASRVDSVIVEWLGGGRQVLAAPRLNRVLVLDQNTDP